MSRVEEYIKAAESYSFSFGDSYSLHLAEENVYFMQRYLDGKITAKELVYILSDTCPDDQLIDYEGKCGDSDDYEGHRVKCCEECWMKVLELEEE